MTPRRAERTLCLFRAGRAEISIFALYNLAADFFAMRYPEAADILQNIGVEPKTERFAGLFFCVKRVATREPPSVPPSA
jgi:hypothetical protein